MNKIHLLPFVLFLFMVSFFAGCIEKENGISSNGGDEFAFTALDGSTGHLSDYRGKVVVLDLWATWCTPCQYQMLELKKIYDHYSRSELEILSINVHPSEGLQQIQDYVDSFGYDWVFGNDDGSIWNHYKIGGGIPTLCIFDRDGNLQFSHEGVCVFSDIPPGWPSDTVKLAPIIDGLLE